MSGESASRVVAGVRSQGRSYRGRTLIGVSAIAVALASLTAGPALAQPIAGSLSGVVTAQAGGGVVAGADVFLTPATAAAPALHTTTGVDGSYSFSDVTPGHYGLDAVAPGLHNALTAFIGIANGATVGDLSLVPGGSITGTITGPDGKPLAGVSVHASVIPTDYAWSRFLAVTSFANPHLVQHTQTEQISASAVTSDNLGPGRAVTASDGTYTINGLAPGRYGVQFTHDAMWAPNPLDRTVTSPAGSATASAQFPAGASVSGVVKAADASPMVNAQVFVSCGTLANVSGTTPFQLYPTSYVATHSDGSGSYAISGIPAGQCAVWAVLAGHRFLSSDSFASTASGSSVINLTETDLGSISGQVVDASDAPVPNAVVQIGGTASQILITDASGNFTVSGVSFGDYTVDVNAPNVGAALGDATTQHVTLSAGSPSATLKVTLPAASAVTGAVTSPNGAPATGAVVWLDDGTEICCTASALVFSDGHYFFDNVPAGTYTLRVEAAGFDQAPARAVVVPETATTITQDAQLRPLSAATVPPRPSVKATTTSEWFDLAAFSGRGVLDGGNPIDSLSVVAQPGGQSCDPKFGACRVTHLAGGMTYAVKVRVHNDVGWSPTRTLTVHTTPYPGVSSLYAWPGRSGSSTITFNTPGTSSSTSGGKFSAHVVKYQLEYLAKGHWKVAAHARSTAKTLVVSGLRPNGIYKCRLTPVMTKGHAKSVLFQLRAGA